MFKKLVVLLSCFAIVALAYPLQPHQQVAAEDEAPRLTIESRISPANNLDPRNETTIVTSPVNPQIVVGASKLMLGGGNGSGVTRVATYASSDGGQSWETNVLSLDTPQKTWGRVTDPVLAVDLNGVFYLCVLMLDNSSFDSGIYIYSSTDGGRNFANPVPATFDIGSGGAPKLADKCYLTVDTSPTSPFKNSLYAVWTLTDQSPTGQNRAAIKFAYRRPGEDAFTTPKSISHEGDMRGPSIATGPNGEVYAAWEGIGNPKVILFNASTDGGATFLPLEVAPSIDLNVHSFVGSLSAPGATIQIAGVPRMNSFPIIDVDRSPGVGRGMIYIAWAETRNNFDADIYVKRLTPPNGGRPEISQPVRVNNDPAGADQFFPWLSVDPSNGAIVVAFYDRRDSGSSLMNCYVARSTDGGLSFGENTRVSSAGSDPRVQANVTGTTGGAIGIGDYLGVYARHDKAYVLWMDTRDAQQSIYYGLVEYSSSGGGGGKPIHDDCAAALPILATPFSQELDTRLATTATDDPVTCTGNANSGSVWYSFTPTSSGVYGVSTEGSEYDTVLSVWSGNCGALAQVACSDDFATAAEDRRNALLTFAATAGTTYLLEVSGKGEGGLLRLRVGHPIITGVNYELAPDERFGLRVSGAGFVDGSARVLIQKEGESVPLELPTTFFMGNRQGDNTFAQIFGVIKKLKKHVKPNRRVTVWVESPAGSGNRSNRYLYIRQ